MKLIPKTLLYTALATAIFSAQGQVYLLKDNKVVAVYPDSAVDAISFEDPTEYNVKTKSEHLVEAYYADALTDVDYNYALQITDLPFDEDGFLPYEAVYYMVRLNANPDETLPLPLVSPGSYMLNTSDVAVPNTICGGERSYVVTQGEPHYFTQAMMTVDYVDYNTVIHFTATDEDGNTYCTDFDGKISFTDYSIDWISEDIHIDGGKLIASYIGDRVRNGANINITIASQGYDNEGWLIAPCDYITFVGNVPLDANGEIIPGEWPIIKGNEIAPGTFQAGYSINFLGGAFPSGTNVKHYINDKDIEVGLIGQGTVALEKIGKEYTLTYNLTSDKDVKVTGTWSGELVVENAPLDLNPYALEHDIWINTEDMKVSYVRRSDECLLRFEKFNKNYRYIGDNLEIEFVPNNKDCLDGVYSFNPEEATAGSLIEGEWECTQYGSYAYGTTYTLYPEDGSQQPLKGAALVDGSVTINDNGDGTYTVDFTLFDNQSTPRYVAGSYTGAIEGL